jgi:nucleotide-binding universal stress UspA family protein
VIALRRILVATDFSEPSEAAVRYGMEVAQRFDATLHLLHVVDDLAAHPSALDVIPEDTGVVQAQLEAEAHANLASLQPDPDGFGPRVEMHVAVSPSPARAILAYARDAAVDLIIVGTHGRHGLAHFFLGSVAQHVARLADCPVLTVRAHERDFVIADRYAAHSELAIQH